MMEHQLVVAPTTPKLPNRWYKSPWFGLVEEQELDPMLVPVGTPCSSMTENTF